MPQHPPSDLPPPASRKGGAPKGNLNALKHGRRSRRVQNINRVLRVLKDNSEVARALQLDQEKREVYALTLRVFADLLVAAPDGVSVEDVLPRLMTRAADRAKKAQTTGKEDPPGTNNPQTTSKS